MEVLSMSTDSGSFQERFDSWRTAVCKMIYKVSVDTAVLTNFNARMVARRQGDIGCALFTSRPHDVRSAREGYSNAGSAGYLVSWQLAGTAYIEQGDLRTTLEPGQVAVVDGRRQMRVSFPSDVRRIVAKLPARLVERRLPFLARSHAIAFQPQGPFSSLLLTYLTELASGTSIISASDFELVAENLCNLLKITSARSGANERSSQELRKEALVRLLRGACCDPDLSLDVVSARLNMSRRSVQKALQDIDTSFTDFITEERLQSAERRLLEMPHTPISEIAYASGFTDISHFNHRFKRHFGVTPTDRRKQLLPTYRDLVATCPASGA